MAGYATFFKGVTGNEPFPYQLRVGTEPWPGVVDVPTGLGKTAAVVVAWLWKRLEDDEQTPRRLVYCLPMRVLVDQCSRTLEEWLARAEPYFRERGIEVPLVRTLMGGAVVNDDWRRKPQHPAVLVGTQDMLLSRALMRGYGMSRYQWPVDYALLHNDAMWVYDEVQLMGPALETSAQLEAFRRHWPSARPCRSLWLSATLREDWLETVDFAPHARDLTALRISTEDRETISGRLSAKKVLSKSRVTLEGTSGKDVASYAEHLAAEIGERHRPGSQTVVVVNRVDRAQALYRALRNAVPEVDALLLHARFRGAERAEIEEKLRQVEFPEAGRIVVATQAIEAGVDMTSAVLFTELAPWSSMVQRFGRCNRYGEVPGGADVVWVDSVLEGKDAAPYDAFDLNAARETLNAMGDDVSPQVMPPVSSDRPVYQVVRRQDFSELFDTDPDLQGFDVDIAPYIRDQGSPQVQVFWRDFEEAPPEDLPTPAREEVCNVSMGQLHEFLKKKTKKRVRWAWRWDPLLERWQRKSNNDAITPGSTLLLRAADGGYDTELGFEPTEKGHVSDLSPSEGVARDTYPGDVGSQARSWVELSVHLEDAMEQAQRMSAALSLPRAEESAVVTAALWHDVGKAHPAFVTAMLDAAEPQDGRDSKLWAKSPGRGRPSYRVIADGETVQRRPYFRHELPSMLAWLTHNGHRPDSDLVAFLIAAHHGKVRMGLRAMPHEPIPEDERLVARGVWEGDVLPSLTFGGDEIPSTELRLDLMRMGRGRAGPSWTERTQGLLHVRGPFVLSWLEMLVRLADWHASASEEETHDD